MQRGAINMSEAKGPPFSHWSTSSQGTVLKKRALNALCLIRRRKRTAFFSLGHVLSRNGPKKRALNALCLIRRRKRTAFFSLGHVLSRNGPKKRALNALCLIRRDKIPPFFHWSLLFLNDTCQAQQSACPIIGPTFLFDSRVP